MPKANGGYSALPNDCAIITMHHSSLFIRPHSLPGLEIRYGEGCELAYRLHTHDSYSLGLVLAGETRYQCQKRHYHSSAGDGLCIGPDTPHACNPLGGEWRYLMCQIDPALWPQNVQANGIPFRNAAFNAALLGLWHGAQRGRDISADWLRVCAALNLARNTTRAADEHWRRILATLQDDHATIEAWAADARISCRQLARLLAPSGMSPHQWLLSRRINRSKTLLRAGWPLADIAHALGFADQAHFQRLFKYHTAVPPGQYRQTSGKYGGFLENPGRQSIE